MDRGRLAMGIERAIPRSRGSRANRSVRRVPPRRTRDSLLGLRCSLDGGSEPRDSKNSPRSRELFRSPATLRVVASIPSLKMDTRKSPFRGSQAGTCVWFCVGVSTQVISECFDYSRDVHYRDPGLFGIVLPAETPKSATFERPSAFSLYFFPLSIGGSRSFKVKHHFRITSVTRALLFCPPDMKLKGIGTGKSQP